MLLYSGHQLSPVTESPYFEPSSLRSSFTSTLTISSLAMTDAGQYYCEVTVHSSSHIIASDLGIRPLLNLTFQRVDHDTGKHLSLIMGCSLNLTFFQSQLSWFWFYKSTLNYASCLITFFFTTYSCNCFLQTIDIHLVEEFRGEVSASWAHTSIEATLRTRYNLTCVPLMAGIPVPPPLQLATPKRYLS